TSLSLPSGLPSRRARRAIPPGAPATCHHPCRLSCGPRQAAHPTTQPLSVSRTTAVAFCFVLTAPGAVAGRRGLRPTFERCQQPLHKPGLSPSALVAGLVTRVPASPGQALYEL